MTVGLNTSLQAWSSKAVTDNWDFVEIKNFCSAKDTDKRIRKQATDTLIKEQYPKYIKNSENWAITHQIKKGQNL
jgi:hypothetical protein